MGAFLHMRECDHGIDHQATKPSNSYCYCSYIPRLTTRASDTWFPHMFDCWDSKRKKCNQSVGRRPPASRGRSPQAAASHHDPPSSSAHARTMMPTQHLSHPHTKMLPCSLPCRFRFCPHTKPPNAPLHPIMSKHLAVQDWHTRLQPWW